MDRLVQLLETPVFTPLRLQLLHPAHHPALLRRAPSRRTLQEKVMQGWTMLAD